MFGPMHMPLMHIKVAGGRKVYIGASGLGRKSAESNPAKDEFAGNSYHR